MKQFFLAALTLTFGTQVAGADIQQRLEQVESTLKTLTEQNEKLLSQLKLARGKGEYPINDQHDTLSLLLEEVIGDIETNHAAALSHTQILERLTEGYQSGSIPERSVKAMQVQVKLDALDHKGLPLRQRSIQYKLISLRALRNGNLVEFAQNDRDTNKTQLAWFEFELQKAELASRYASEVHFILSDLYVKGAGPWRSQLDSQTDKLKATALVATWKRKVAQQRSQLHAAETEYERLGGSPR